MGYSLWLILRNSGLHYLLGLSLVLTWLTLTTLLHTGSALKTGDFCTSRSSYLALFCLSVGLSGISHYVADALSWGF